MLVVLRFDLGSDPGKRTVLPIRDGIFPKVQPRKIASVGGFPAGPPGYEFGYEPVPEPVPDLLALSVNGSPNKR